MEDKVHRLAASHGTAIRLQSGQSVKITNTFGSQVVDTWVVSAQDPLEYSSMEHTRSVNSSIFLGPGQKIVSNRRAALMTMTADSSPGRHDTQLCPCSAELYQELNAAPDHRSCSGNFHEALSDIGLTLPFTPASLNLFMNVPITEDGQILRQPPISRAGDSVTLRAERDVILILSACPQDITPINGAECLPRDIAWQVLPAIATSLPGAIHD